MYCVPPYPLLYLIYLDMNTWADFQSKAIEKSVLKERLSMEYMLSAVHSYTPASICVAGSISILDLTRSSPIGHSWIWNKCHTRLQDRPVPHFHWSALVSINNGTVCLCDRSALWHVHKIINGYIKIKEKVIKRTCR